MQIRSHLILLVGLLISLTLSLGSTSTLHACPLCPGSKQKTISQRILSFDVVIVVRLIEKAKQPVPEETELLPGSEEYKKSRFRLVEVLKGEKHLGRKKVFESVYFGDAKEGSTFMLMALDPPDLIWTTAKDPLNDEVLSYTKKVMKLPEKGTQRLVFFQNYFEHKEKQIAEDVYNEFAKTPYEEIQKVKKHLKRERLVDWLRESKIPVNRRRLYIMLLGTCGTADDIAMFEEMIKSSDPTKKQALDAIVASYLILKGPVGLDLIDQQIFRNKKAPFPEVYSSMMGIRVLAEAVKGIIPKKRLLESVRLLLDRPNVADSVIPDLARWEDWSVVDRMVKLFKESDPEKTWVRTPIINYLKICPKKEAKVALVELKKVDPQAFKEAEELFQFSPDRKKVVSEDKKALKKKAPKTTPASKEEKSNTQIELEAEEESPQLTVAPASETEQMENRLYTVGVPILISLVLFLVFLVILRVPNNHAIS